MVWKTICLVFLFATLRGESIETTLNYANAYFTLGEPQKAIPLYQKLLTESLSANQKLIVLYNLGSAFVANDEPEKSLSPLQEAIHVKNLPPTIKAKILESATAALNHIEKPTQIPDIKKNGALEQAILKQKNATVLTKNLPFQDPYQSTHATEVIASQKQVVGMGPLFAPDLYKIQQEMTKTTCPLYMWKSITEHIQAGLDLAQLAYQALKLQALPYVQVIPLQLLALSEWEMGQKKLEQLPQVGQKQELITTENRDKLRELFYQDKEEEKEAPRPIPEGVVW